jgi:hypothetical protein
VIRIRKPHPNSSTRTYSVCCDSKGQTGCWSCENLGPESLVRDDAAKAAKAAGWIVARNKWYCPECQRDGFSPKSKSQLQLQLRR